MRLISILLVLLTLVACSTPNRGPASNSTTSRHFIFLIYGIGGSKETFGEMERALVTSLDENVITRSIEYSTGDHQLDTRFFAKEVSEAIKKIVLENGGFLEKDKVSMIMHSQGGIVGTIYLYELFKGNPLFWQEPKKHMDSFITLGTPYWGAKVANIGDELSGIVQSIDALKMGKNELKGMSFYSDTIYNFRHTIIDKNFADLIEEIKKSVRIMHLAGKASALNFLAPFVVGKNAYEDDGAVSIPSSRFDFLYYVQEESDHSRSIKKEQFESTALIENYKIIDALHVSHKGDDPKYYAEAFIPKDCIDEIICDHPSYKLIVPFLMGAELPPVADQNVTSFIVTFNVRFKMPVSRAARVGITMSGDEVDKSVVLGKITEPYHFGDQWVDKNHYRLFFTGYVKEGQHGTVKFKLQNFLKNPSLVKEIVAPVEVGKTTFIDINGD